MNVPEKRKYDFTKAPAAKGEPFVWLTAMGLALGLLMVVGLLGVIVSNGIPVFWPKQVLEIKLKPGVQNPVPEGGDMIVGELVQKRTKRIPVLNEQGQRNNDQTEIQVFLGNKDTYNINFAFANQADITSISEAKNIYRLERLEYGIAFGYPTAIRLADGTLIEVNAASFGSTLARLCEEAASRRAQIEKIEKTEIGRINSRLNDLRVSQKGDSTPSPEAAKLDAEYQKLAAQAAKLRAEQGAIALIYKTPTGVERTLSLGDLVSYSKPNQLTLLDKVRLFSHNIWSFLTENPREANTEGGIFPAIFGTFAMTLLMSLAVVPFGVVAAIYLREYAKQGLFVHCVRIAVNNLAGVPSIVFGVFGLGFFVYFVGGSIDQLFFGKYLPTPTFGTGGVFWAALTLALMTVPVVIVATEEAISASPLEFSSSSIESFICSNDSCKLF